MKFSRSLFGYDPVNVDTELEFMILGQKRAEDEKRLAGGRAQKEHEQLLTKMDSVKGRLEADHGVVLLTDKYQNYVRTNLVQKANDMAEEKIQKLLKDAEEFETDVAAKNSEMDGKINSLTREIKSVTKVIQDILEFNDFGKTMMDTQLNEINNMISEFQFRADSMLDLNGIEQNEISFQEIENKSLEEPLLAAAVTQTEFSLATTASAAKPTILLVENDEDSAILIRYFLEREGYQVIHMENGSQASQLVQESPAPSLIVLNVMLPDVDGIQLIRQIRGREEWKAVPIIGLTEMNSERDVVEILDSGANDCLKKPFNPRELVARVKRFCNCSEKG